MRLLGDTKGTSSQNKFVLQQKLCIYFGELAILLIAMLFRFTNVATEYDCVCLFVLWPFYMNNFLLLHVFRCKW